MQGAWTGVLQRYRGEAMQDLGYELPRIPIPRTPVNKGKEKGRGYFAPALPSCRGYFAPALPSYSSD